VSSSPLLSPLFSVSTLFLSRSPGSSLFPYTTLFRSCDSCREPGCPGTADAGGTPGVAAGRERRALHPARLAPAARHRVIRSDRRSEEHTSELQSRFDLVCRLLLEKKKKSESKSGSMP